MLSALFMCVNAFFMLGVSLTCMSASLIFVSIASLLLGASLMHRYIWGKK
jgi:hypothetical protein